MSPVRHQVDDRAAPQTQAVDAGPGRGVCVFSPGLRLTVTVEAGAQGDEIHLHPGGQGYWVARGIERLGEPVVLCATVGGEVGDVLLPLLQSQTGVQLVAVRQAGPSKVSIYDRRSGSRTLIARTDPSPIDRHAADQLYSLTLSNAIGQGCCLLAGNVDTGVLPPTYYGRLCADLTAVGVPIIADLHGPELPEILDSSAVRLIKLSDEDLYHDALIGDDLQSGLVDAVSRLADRIRHDLVVTRGPDRPAVARIDRRWYRASPPRLAAVDWRGAGDAMAGAMAVAYVRGLVGVDVLRFGVAAGAASVTRRGLASLDAQLVDALVARVRVDAVDGLERALRS